MNKFLYYLMHPCVAVSALLYKCSDRYAIKYMWKRRMNYPLDLTKPRSFNEKLQWLKLNDRKPIYHKLVDKYEVKKFVSEKIGEEYVVKTYAVYDSVEDIDFNALPDSFVLKCTHNSGSFVVCPNKNALDIEEALKILKQGMNCKDYYKCSREWVYKGVKPRIIAEEYLEDSTFEDLVNYKFWCFNGKPQIMYITVKTDDIWENFYDMEFNQLEISHGFKQYKGIISKPLQFERMKELAEVLSDNFYHIRIDFYQISGKIKFSEYTFYDWAGFRPFDNIEWDYKIGDLFNL